MILPETCDGALAPVTLTVSTKSLVSAPDASAAPDVPAPSPPVSTPETTPQPQESSAKCISANIWAFQTILLFLATQTAAAATFFV